jgi:hypothetical protein
MKNYSRMSHDELRGIADNDSLAESMSEEEYETLSVELWRKFSMEKGLRERPASYTPLSPNRKPLRGIVDVTPPIQSQ